MLYLNKYHDKKPQKFIHVNNLLPFVTLSPFQKIHYKKDCKKLYEDLKKDKPIIAILATGMGIQTVDIFLLLRNYLLNAGYTVIFLLHKSGIERTLSLCPPQNRDNIYILRDIELLEWCPFISILFTSENGIGYSNKLKNFSGKLVFLAHSFSVAYPFGSLSSLSADYVIAPLRIRSNFPYLWYPNIAKITSNYNLTIIPGYAKMDLLANRCRIEKNIFYKRISFYATLASVAPKRNLDVFLNDFINLIESFFVLYPDWEFVLRPFPGDKGNTLLKKVTNHFSSNSHFIYDTGSDAYKYLISSDLLIIDYSTVFTNFVYGTLRPVIWFRPGDPNFNIGRGVNTKFGYVTNTVQQVLEAIKDYISNNKKWKESILKIREQDVPHFGLTCQYIAEHINNILYDKPCNDWVIINKGNTPYSYIADYLKMLKPNAIKNALILCKDAAITKWACNQHGPNLKIGLAIIRAFICHWPTPSHLFYNNFYIQIQSAFNFVPSPYILGVLRHLAKKTTFQNVAYVWLAEALSRWAPNSSDLPQILNRLKFLTIDPILASVASRLVYRHNNAPETALAILEHALPDKYINMPDLVYTIYASLLWELKKYEECKQMIEIWQNNLLLKVYL